jgi:hypothetical protein
MIPKDIAIIGIKRGVKSPIKSFTYPIVDETLSVVKSKNVVSKTGIFFI